MSESEMVILDRDSCMALLNILDIEKKCSSCGAEITRENFGGCFNEGKTISCNSIFCINECMPL